jgi:sarcosine oxidase subunit beta
MRRSRKKLAPSTTTLIIGGGIIGTSAAFHLAEAGVDVVLVDKGQLASGSTSKAAGGVRAQFSDALNIEIGQRSLRAFKEFATRPGWEIDLKEVGYLFLLSSSLAVEEFERGIAVQNALGVPSRLLTPHAAKKLSPLLEVDGLLAAAYSPEDGHATPEAAVQGYAFGARRYGADVRVDCEVLDIRTVNDRITEVVTTHGNIRTGTVICAAGAWSRACAQMVGVDLPVTPLRRQVLITEAMHDLPKHIPVTIDFETSFYYHREGPGLMIGMSHPDERPGFSTEMSDEWVPDLLRIAEHRAPRIAATGIRGGWAGLYEMSPDRNAMIGEAPSPSRFLYATGFSGHGFLQGPAVGEILRDLVLGRPTFDDVSPLSADRFSGPKLRPEFNVV